MKYDRKTIAIFLAPSSAFFVGAISMGGSLGAGVLAVILAYPISIIFGYPLLCILRASNHLGILSFIGAGLLSGVMFYGAFILIQGHTENFSLSSIMLGLLYICLHTVSVAVTYWFLAYSNIFIKN